MLPLPSCDLPAEFDPATYRRNRHDVDHYTDAELLAHYRELGVAQGTVASPGATRAYFLDLLARQRSILEIGPLANPIVRGPHVKYFDVLPTDALKRKAASLGLDPNACPNIDFHSETADLAVIDEHFDAVVSSHAVEHQPDLVGHLRDVSILLPVGGRYFLAVPDKRYCFDYFLAQSTIADVLDAHVRGAKFHTAASVINHFAYITHNDPARHWRDDHGQPAYLENADTIVRGVAEVVGHPDTYIDTHAWQFVPDSFREITRLLYELGYSSLKPLRVYDTAHGWNEFYAVLEKTRENSTSLLDPLPRNFDAAAYLIANPDVAQAGMDAAAHYRQYGFREGRRLGP